MSEVKSLLNQLWDEATEPGEFDGMTDAQISEELRLETARMLNGLDYGGLASQVDNALHSIKCELELIEQVRDELRRRAGGKIQTSPIHVAVPNQVH